MAYTTDETLTVLVYSHDRNTREQVLTALGRRPAADLPELSYLECATTPAVLKALEKGAWTSACWTARRCRPEGWGSGGS